MPKPKPVETERDYLLRTQLRPQDRGRYSEAELNQAIAAYCEWREKNVAWGILEVGDEVGEYWLSEWFDLRRIEAAEAEVGPMVSRTEFNGFHSMPSPLTWNA